MYMDVYFELDETTLIIFEILKISILWCLVDTMVGVCVCKCPTVRYGWLVASYPVFTGGGKNAWFQPFAHVRS